MFNPTSSSAIFGRTATSLPGTSTAQREEITPVQGTTNKERAIKRFEVELEKLRGQGSHSDNESVASFSTDAAQKLSSSSDQLIENEQYAKALLIAVREEIYKKGYKSSNKLRAALPGEGKNQWVKRESERLSKVGAELGRIRAQLPSSATAIYFLAIQEKIQNTIESKGHNCEDLTFAGIGILDEAGIKDTHIVSFFGFNHGIILFGKIPRSGLPVMMDQWPSHLAICDPWANIACSAKEFVPAFMAKMQKWESHGKKIQDPETGDWNNPVSPDLEIKLKSPCFVLTSLTWKEFKNKDGCTPLLTAAYSGKVDDIQILIKAGADIDARDNKGRSPLHAAACKGNATALSALIKAGADIEAKDNDGVTPLMAAASSAHAEAQSILLQAGAQDRCTPLMAAIHDGNVNKVEALLKEGVDIETKDGHGMPPLLLATEKNNTEMVDLLLKARAGTDTRNKQGKTALMIAAESGNVELVKALLKAGATIEAKDKQGKTPLVYAAESGKVDVIEALLEAGAEADVPDHKGNTPLMYAACLGHLMIVEALLKADADKDALNRDGITPLIFAVLEGKFEVVDALFKAEVNKDVQIQGNNKRYIALALAAIEGKIVEAASLIKEADADRVRDPNGKTVLIRAVEMMASDSDSCRKLGLQILQTLLAADADVTIQDSEGKTAKEYATELATARNDNKLLALIGAVSQK